MAFTKSEKRQIAFTAETSVGIPLSDAIYIPLYENVPDDQKSVIYTDPDTVSQTWLDSQIAQRVANFEYAINNPAPVVEVPVEDQMASLDEMLTNIQQQKNDLIMRMPELTLAPEEVVSSVDSQIASIDSQIADLESRKTSLTQMKSTAQLSIGKEDFILSGLDAETIGII